MRHFLAAIILLIATTSSFALNNRISMTCDGYDGAGGRVHLTAASDSPYVTINNSTLRIVGKTKNNLGVVTESFISTSGILVYDSLVPFSDTGLNVYQFNAVTEKLLAQATLYCQFSGANIAAYSVKEIGIFK